MPALDKKRYLVVTLVFVLIIITIFLSQIKLNKKNLTNFLAKPSPSQYIPEYQPFTQGKIVNGIFLSQDKKTIAINTASGSATFNLDPNVAINMPTFPGKTATSAGSLLVVQKSIDDIKKGSKISLEFDQTAQKVILIGISEEK